MHEILKNYFEEKEKERIESVNKEKYELLISQGLCERVYSDKEEYDPEFPYSEYSSANSLRYYKNAPIDVTDEEYSKLLEICKPKKEEKNNAVASALTAIGWIIFICGFIAGCVFGEEKIIYHDYFGEHIETEFSFAVALTYWAVSFISGIFILGFAEVIKILNTINNRLSD